MVSQSAPRKQVIIVGASETGLALARSLCTTWNVTVLAATAALGVQAAHWCTAATRDPPDGTLWSRLRVVVEALGQRGEVRLAVVVGTVVVGAAAIGLARGRAWGALLAIGGAAAVIAVAMLARHLAIDAEPRRYVARSPYVRGATAIAIAVLVGHGLVGVVATRRAYRARVRGVLARVALGGAAAARIMGMGFFGEAVKTVGIANIHLIFMKLSQAGRIPKDGGGVIRNRGIGFSHGIGACAMTYGKKIPISDKGSLAKRDHK